MNHKITSYLLPRNLCFAPNPLINIASDIDFMYSLTFMYLFLKTPSLSQVTVEVCFGFKMLNTPHFTEFTVGVEPEEESKSVVWLRDGW